MDGSADGRGDDGVDLPFSGLEGGSSGTSSRRVQQWHGKHDEEKEVRRLHVAEKINTRRSRG
jgi:hypothetical protein